VEGRVQGVGFRYATCARAEALGLHGWVRNLPDGRVEAEFEGAEAVLDDMLDWCGQGPAFAYVTSVEATRESGEPRYQEFRIRHEY
jgi:acylphosphatase